MAIGVAGKFPAMNDRDSIDTRNHGLIHVRWRGVVTGPYLEQTILQMLRDNSITKHHEISRDSVRWSSIARSDLLSKAFNQSSNANSQAKGIVVNHSATKSMHNAISLQDRRSEHGTGIAPNRECGNQDPLDISVSSHPLAMVLFEIKSVPWILAFGLSPLLILFLQSLLGLYFAQIAWLFSAYFCALWAYIVGRLADRNTETWKTGILYAVFTAFIGIAMLLIWRFIPVIGSLYGAIESANPIKRLLGFVFGVGICEELCKAAPLLIFGLRSKILQSPVDGLFLGMMSGLGFAMNEGVGYTIQYWSAASDLGATSFEQYGQILVVQLVRFMSLPLLHAAWAGLVGYGIAYAFLNARWEFVFLSIGAAAILHGFYNFASPTVYSLLIAGLSMSLTLSLLVRETQSHRRCFS
ncbi:MAG: PrsW family intramembrane metalloprotease [bacterium]